MNQIIQPAASSLAIQESPYSRMISLAFEGGKLDTLDRLFGLQLKWEANEARKAYAKSLAAMKATIPIEVFKRKNVNIPGGAKFKHADLADVVDAAVTAMGQFGFVHSWKPTAQTDEFLEVTCTITHELGHKEETTLRSGYDNSNPKMSQLHRLGSTMTYLERYTLVAALGVAAKNIDDDGNGGSPPKVEAEAPAGYDKWEADMGALADEGMQRLSDVWKTSDGAFRRHVIKHREDWWETTKNKAVKSDQKRGSR